VLKRCMLPQVMLVMTRTKFDLNMIKRCGNTALCLFSEALHKISLRVFRKQFEKST